MRTATAPADTTAPAARDRVRFTLLDRARAARSAWHNPNAAFTGGLLAGAWLYPAAKTAAAARNGA